MDTLYRMEVLVEGEWYGICSARNEYEKKYEGIRGVFNQIDDILKLSLGRFCSDCSDILTQSGIDSIRYEYSVINYTGINHKSYSFYNHKWKFWFVEDSYFKVKDKVIARAEDKELQIRLLTMEYDATLPHVRSDTQVAYLDIDKPFDM